MKNRVFLPADILLPTYSPDDERWTAYSVIACDQFTSEREYWDEAEKVAKGNLSTLGLILPEAYLETPFENEHKAVIDNNMATIEEKLACHENCLIYVERVLPDGRLRRGIVGKVDLECYDFSPDSQSHVRATEKTVIERIPPRVAVRSKALVELPHVMIFACDSERRLIEGLSEKKDEMELVYSFSLMLGGGSIRGYKITGDMLSFVEKEIERYENGVSDGLVYAMGDGNHSLASAKAHYGNIKALLGESAEKHPARYALCEMVNIYEDSIEFEPIYRLLVNCDADDLLAYIDARKKDANESFSVTAIVENREISAEIPALHALAVGSLQMIVDDYIKEHPEVVCDYIHGVESLRALSAKEGSVGFLFDGVKKEELFSYVSKNGTLPRKTFSMGEAASKRYYIEARKISE